MDGESRQTYYENPELWVPSRYGDSEMERARIIRELIPRRMESVLDVGCGNGILINELHGVRRIVGLDRSMSALRQVKVPRCVGDAGGLPFRDASFDLVITTELLEHLPWADYRKALGEIVRVCRRYILVTVPYREDRELNQVKCPLCGCRFHRYYHMRSYDLGDVRRLFEEWKGVGPERIDGICPMKVRLGSSALIRVRRALGGWNGGYPNECVCPQCGHMARGTAIASGVERHSFVDGVIDCGRYLLRRVCPSRVTFKWWVALFRKVE